MPRLRLAFVAISLTTLAAIVASTEWVLAHGDEVRLRGEWQAKIDRYSIQFRHGATRAEVEAALDRSQAGRQSFSGGLTDANESTFKDQVLLGTRPNHLCGTVVYAYAIFAYKEAALAGVYTDDPNEPLRRVYLEEVDSCGVI